MKKRLVLASASPRRAELLRMIHADFRVCVSNVDETLEEIVTIPNHVMMIAMRKAEFVAGQLKSQQESALFENPTLFEKSTQYEDFVLGADTVVISSEEKILGKPKDAAEAFQMLTQLSGKWHEVYTGIALVDIRGERKQVDFERTSVKFSDIDEDKIKHYLMTGESFDKAGSYAIQGLGSLLVERIDGCYYNVVGLPINKLALMLSAWDCYLL